MQREPCGIFHIEHEFLDGASPAVLDQRALERELRAERRPFERERNRMGVLVARCIGAKPLDFESRRRGVAHAQLDEAVRVGWIRHIQIELKRFGAHVADAQIGAACLTVDREVRPLPERGERRVQASARIGHPIIERGHLDARNGVRSRTMFRLESKAACT